MTSTFTAITKKDGDWWIGWIEEVPGVNAQEKTKEELLASLVGKGVSQRFLTEFARFVSQVESF